MGEIEKGIRATKGRAKNTKDGKKKTQNCGILGSCEEAAAREFILFTNDQYATGILKQDERIVGKKSETLVLSSMIQELFWRIAESRQDINRLL